MPKPNHHVAAIDLGATSGRVIIGTLSDHPTPRLHLKQIARFPNDPLSTSLGLQWDLPALFEQICVGIEKTARASDLASIGIDSWGVDYSLITAGEHSLPFHYRDERNHEGVKRTHARVPFEELYERNGLQLLPFNTVYQLATEPPGRLSQADHLLLTPDLIAYLLTGEVSTERTIASTSGLLHVSGEWDVELMEALDLPRHLFSSLVDPGDMTGRTSRTALPGAPNIPVIAVGSHDTASAVAAVPMNPDEAAYISCGTWGLVGVETPAPIATTAARKAEFTNEGGVDGRNRFLHNVMGLWLLSESMRTWNTGLPGNKQLQLPDLLTRAAALTPPAHGWIFDTNDPAFLPPGDMPARIHAWFTNRGIEPPATPPEMVRAIIESLAAAFARAVRTAADLSGLAVETIHIVGGGSLNELLCQRTADHAALPVLAGPVEATAIGNLLVQARTHGWIGNDLAAIRDVVSRSFSVKRYEPTNR